MAFADDSAASALPSNPRWKEAQAHFHGGLALAQAAQTADDWNRALKEFLLSRQAFPTKSATRNAAIALQQLHRYVEAVELYTSLLAEFSPLPDQQSVVAAMNAAKLHVGELELHTNEAGIAVIIDGVERGTTPLAEPIQLDEGKYTLKLNKQGFEPAEIALTVEGGGRQKIQRSLRKLAETGLLVVSEAGEKQLNVVVDSAVVGQTPWHGALAPGRHLVLLRGLKNQDNNLGTAPSSVQVKLNETTPLTLRAVELNAALQIEPTPSNASVYLDDVALGDGVWVGRVPSGQHRVDVIAAGHLAFRREMRVDSGESVTVHAHLERDISNPIWHTALSIPLYFELAGGALIGDSFRGGADESCGCSKRAHPLGAIAELRVGYAFGRLGVELSGGYLSISESMTRRSVVATGDRTAPQFKATGYKDATTLHGPLAAMSVSYRMLEKTPLTARAGVGLLGLTANTSNSGTFAGQATNPDDATDTQELRSQVSIAETPQSLLTPFTWTELRIGYRFSRFLSADLGASIMLFFPPKAARVSPDGDNEVRAASLGAAPPPMWRDQSLVHQPVVQLPNEDIARTFLAVSPSVAIRASF